jgi:hypothetical protein
MYARVNRTILVSIPDFIVRKRGEMDEEKREKMLDKTNKKKKKKLLLSNER